MVRRKRRMKELKDHPPWAMRFDPVEWDGEPLEAFETWKARLWEYWKEQAAAGDVELPVGTVMKSDEAHIFWVLGRIGEGRRLARAVSGGE